MPDLDKILKDEIRRLARSESSADLKSLHQSVGSLRKQVTALKRMNALLERKLVALNKLSGPPALPAAKKMKRGARITPSSLKRQRSKIGLTQDQFATLIGVSHPSIVNWRFAVQT